MSVSSWSMHWLATATRTVVAAVFALQAAQLSQGHAAWSMQSEATQVGSHNPDGRIDQPDSRIDQWIEQLGDPSFIKRQTARQQLENTGLLAFEKLRAAVDHRNIEIASSAHYLLESMRVVWTLPTDSYEVQRLLKDYNEYQTSQKLDRMQKLARLHRPDGDLALLRFVRFESNENLSKIAALYLMDAAVDKQLPTAASWSGLIRGGLGDSQRTGAVWLRQLLRSREEKNEDLQPWKQFVLSERKLLESNSEKTSEQAVKRLYRWTAKWLAEQGRRDEALAFCEPSLDLLGNDPSSVLDDITWMLDQGLAEGVIKLAQQKPNLFNRAQIRYLLAESYLKQGDAVAAQRLADSARDLVRVVTPLARADGKFDHEANQRMNLAEHLNVRGMYDWAEAELGRAVALHTTRGHLSTETELSARDQLALFYWGGDQPQRAADVWQPILVRAGVPLDAAELLKQPKLTHANTADRELLAVMTDRDAASGQSFAQYVPSNYHFYLGLVAIKAGDLPKARTELCAAVAFCNQRADGLAALNPDIVIAMAKAVGDDAQFKQETEQVAVKLEQYLRNELMKYESELASASTRQMRQEAERMIASECNQLAWLLAGTGRKPQEAIALSERSLLLSADSPTSLGIFLDTLARCHFAAGNVDKAAELQSQAVGHMPHERQMQRQLSEFEAAKASHKDGSDDANDDAKKASTEKR